MTVLGCLLVSAAVVGPRAALAHNVPAKQIASGIAGPYKYALGVYPVDPQPGSIYLGIALAAAGGSTPIEGARVTIEGVTTGGHFGPLLAAFDGLYYELSAPLTKRGKWDLTVDFQGALGMSQATAAVTVQPPPHKANLWLIAGGATTGGLLACGIGVLVWYRSRHKTVQATSPARGRAKKVR